MKEAQMGKEPALEIGTEVKLNRDRLFAVVDTKSLDGGELEPHPDRTYRISDFGYLEDWFLVQVDDAPSMLVIAHKSMIEAKVGATA
jgi:hypothetical protein